MRIIAKLIIALAAIGAAASFAAFIHNPSEANFMFAVLLGGICYLGVRRLRKGPCLTGSQFGWVKHQNVFGPNEPIDNRDQPIFGPNAKPWFIQFGILIFCIVFVMPVMSRYADTYLKPWFTAGLDAICTSTGLCTPEAAARTRASRDQ